MYLSGILSTAPRNLFVDVFLHVGLMTMVVMLMAMVFAAHYAGQ
jgi:hypothetical protein